MASFTTVIDPHTNHTRYWQEVWRFRELTFFLAWQKILVRYKQTSIGVLWAVLQPVLIMVILSVLFGHFARFPSEGNVPYPVMVYVGVLPWQLATSIFSSVAYSFVTNMALVTKVYFPRIILPISIASVSVLDFLISSLVLVGMMAWYRYVPDWHIIFLPLFILIAILASLGAGLFVACLGVKYRDFRFMVPPLLQIGINLTPVGYSTQIIPDKWKWVYALNPMAGVIEGCRWSIFGGETQLYLPGVFLSAGIACLLLGLGIAYLRKTEQWFADII